MRTLNKPQCDQEGRPGDRGVRSSHTHAATQTEIAAGALGEKPRAGNRNKAGGGDWLLAVENESGEVPPEKHPGGERMGRGRW